MCLGLSIPKYKFISSELTLSEMYQPIYIIITHSSPPKMSQKKQATKYKLLSYIISSILFFGEYVVCVY